MIFVSLIQKTESTREAFPKSDVTIEYSSPSQSHVYLQTHMWPYNV